MHYVSVTEFDWFACNKTKHKNEKHFCRSCLQCFSSEKSLEKHIKIWLKVNGKQSLKVRSGLIEFNDHCKQLAVPFEIYDDFESVLKRVQKTHRDGNASFTEKYQEHILCSFPCKIVCTDDRFSKSTSAVYRFIGEILSKYGYCKKIFKKHFIKKLVTTVADENNLNQVISAEYAINCMEK